MPLLVLQHRNLYGVLRRSLQITNINVHPENGRLPEEFFHRLLCAVVDGFAGMDRHVGKRRFHADRRRASSHLQLIHRVCVLAQKSPTLAGPLASQKIGIAYCALREREIVTPGAAGDKKEAQNSPPTAIKICAVHLALLRSARQFLRLPRIRKVPRVGGRQATPPEPSPGPLLPYFAQPPLVP